MKFVCERCNTRYSIADEKVRQKILKIRCKTCDYVITVRETGAVPTGATTVPPPSRASVPGPAMPAAAPMPVEWHVAINGEQIGPFTRAEAAKRIAVARKEDEVYVWKEDFADWKEAKDVPVLAQAVSALRARASVPPPAPSRLGSTPALPKPSGNMRASSAPTATRPAERSAPTAARPGAAVAASLNTTDLSESFSEDESTQIQPFDASFVAGAAVGKKQPALSSPGLSAFGRPGAAANGAVSAPGQSASSAVWEEIDFATTPPTAAAGGPTVAAALALPNGGGQGFFPASLPSVAGAGAPMVAEAGLSRLAGLPGFASRNPALKYIFGSVAVVTILIALVVVTMRSQSQPKLASAPGGASAASSSGASKEELERRAREEVKQRFNTSIGVQSPSVAEIRPAPRALPRSGKGAPRSAASPVVAPPAVGAGSAGSLSPEAEAASRRFSQAERRVAPVGTSRATGAATASPANIDRLVAQVIGRKPNQDALKVCYERALKRDDRLNNGRLDVTVSIGSSGMVKAVNVSAPPEFSVLQTCIRGVVKRWIFPANVEEYGSSFTLIVQGGA